MSKVITDLRVQDILLGSNPSREQITRIEKHIRSRTYKVRVDRTMPFEFIAHLLAPFCGLWDANVQLDYSDYDATLSRLGGDYQAEVYLIWLDWRIYHNSKKMEETVLWITNRIQQLQLITDNMIWINNWPESLQHGDALFGLRVGERGSIRRFNEYLSESIKAFPNCELLDLAGLAYDEPAFIYDHRNDVMTSYPFSDSMTIKIAQHIGLQLLPATFLPRIKAITLDLDDTLYNGVLAEDGWDQVHLTEGHYELQRLLLKLKQSGIMLTLCSRNEEQDVRQLFTMREDFLLQWSDFAAIRANWQAKSDNLLELANDLNIDVAAFLFIDDNPVELLAMNEVLPVVRLLHAEFNGMATLMKLSHYPQLYQIDTDQEAALRTADIQGNQTRLQLKEKAIGYGEYLESLQMIITIHINDLSHANRLFDLSRKTNQFNLALRRMSKQESINIMDKSKYMTLTIKLKDIVADSGIIGAFVCRLDGEKATLIEVILSCRALGRDIESVVFTYLVKKLSLRGIKTLNIDVKDGPRNAPAIDWLRRCIQDNWVDINLVGLLDDLGKSCLQHPSIVEVIE